MEQLLPRLMTLGSLVLFSHLSIAQSATCRSNDSQFWAFINASVVKISKYQDSVDSHFLTRVAERIESCAPSIRQAQICTSNLLKFAKAASLKQGLGHRYGLIQSDKEYLADQKVRAMVELPPEFKNGLPKNWKTIAKQKGWKYLEFGSSMVGAFPFNSHRRLVFLIESEAKDLWIMYT
ncbi:MAG: hypothetical protein K2X47_19200, partial [Bdellovibrionales bacterium]|nr:hypothetical protein [Bdellovibrionales bacterium]